MTPRAGEEVAVAKLSFFLFLFASVFSEPKSRRAGRRLMARSNCRQLATCPSMLFDAISASLSPAADRFRRFFVRNVSLNKRIQKNKSVSKKKKQEKKIHGNRGTIFRVRNFGCFEKKTGKRVKMDRAWAQLDSVFFFAPSICSLSEFYCVFFRIDWGFL